MAENKEKNSLSREKKRRLISRIIASVIAIIMILATASTFIYYIISNV